MAHNKRARGTFALSLPHHNGCGARPGVFTCGRGAQADICQLGMDQRKVNVLAREYCDATRPKRKLKPIILSHPMMPGLLVVRPASGALHPSKTA